MYDEMEVMTVEIKSGDPRKPFREVRASVPCLQLATTMGEFLGCLASRQQAATDVAEGSICHAYGCPKPSLLRPTGI